jgi:hypothetical protein
VIVQFNDRFHQSPDIGFDLTIVSRASSTKLRAE